MRVVPQPGHLNPVTARNMQGIRIPKEFKKSKNTAKAKSRSSIFVNLNIRVFISVFTTDYLPKLTPEPELPESVLSVV